MIGAEQLTCTGALALEGKERPYTSEEIEEVIALCETLPIAQGIGDNNLVQCGRILIDPVDFALASTAGDNRRVLDQDAADRILRIIGKPTAMQRWRELLGATRAIIRRAQTNIVAAGGYIGKHTDSESNPEYLANVVIGLTDDYSGGDYVSYHVTCSRFRLRRGTVLISLNNIPHEVTKVIVGKRKTLAFFLAPNEAPPTTGVRR